MALATAMAHLGLGLPNSSVFLNCADTCPEVHTGIYTACWSDCVEQRGGTMAFLRFGHRDLIGDAPTLVGEPGDADACTVPSKYPESGGYLLSSSGTLAWF